MGPYALWGVDFLGWFWAVLWGCQNWKLIFEKTGVGFGRTELSLRLSCTEFCALSSGHGPGVLGFQGGPSGLDFYVFVGGVGGVAIGNDFFKKLGSGLVVRSSR